MADGITKEDITEWVRAYLWSGEYDAEEIPLLIEDQLGTDDELDEEWLEKLIRKELAAKRKAEKTWPEVTDCDKLNRVFETLQTQHIIAIQRAGFTQSDGMEIVEDEYKEAGGKKSKYAGHCFFTEQDQEGAVDGSGLYIGFGHLSGDDAKGVAVGNLLREALVAAGFNVEWDGTIKSRLFVKGFQWQRRTPR